MRAVSPTPGLIPAESDKVNCHSNGEQSWNQGRLSSYKAQPVFPESLQWERESRSCRRSGTLPHGDEFKLNHYPGSIAGRGPDSLLFQAKRGRATAAVAILRELEHGFPGERLTGRSELAPEAAGPPGNFDFPMAPGVDNGNRQFANGRLMLFEAHQYLSNPGIRRIVDRRSLGNDQ